MSDFGIGEPSPAEEASWRTPPRATSREIVDRCSHEQYRHHLACEACIATALAAAEARGWQHGRDAAATAIPTTWLDPLLTGAGAVVNRSGAFDGFDIERLLAALKKRLAALPPPEAAP